MASITLENIAKVYPGGTRAVSDINLDIADGEFIVLVGPSGCGKSTLLRMVAGLETISDGQARIDDKTVNNVEPADRDIAMVFQNYALYPHMSVYNNLAYGLKNRKTPKNEIDKRIRAAAKMLEIEQYLDRKPRALSGGQRQRVAMGRAIVREPKAFLFDEPLSNLDAQLRVAMRTEIKALHQRLTTTIIYVTHDQIEAMTMADRIVVMNGGNIEQIGTPLELYDEPANSFVARFIGSPSMNMLSGTVRGGDFIADDGTVIALGPNVPESAANRPVTLGIRPEHLRLEQNGLAGEIVTVEPTGSETQVSLKFAGHQVVAVFRERITERSGTMLQIAPDHEQIKLFSAETGDRLK